MKIPTSLVWIVSGLFMLVLSPIKAAGINVDNPKHGDVIQYDTRNSLSWCKPIVRRPDGTTITLGGVQLNYRLNGKRFTWTDQDYDLRYPISPQISSIWYFSPREVWLISHLNKRFGGALLLNLEKKKIEKGYSINGPYSISPDNRRIAYTYPIGGHEYDKAIFVNNVMVYPEVGMGFNESDSAEKFVEPNGWKIKKANPNTIGLIYEVSWTGDDSIWFLLEEVGGEHELGRVRNGGRSEGRFFYCTIRGLKAAFAGTKPDPGKIEVSKEQLEYALYYFRDLYELEHGGGTWHGKEYKARAQWMGTPNIRSRDHLVMFVKNEQYYLGGLFVRVLFPKDKFYALKLGGTKEEALKIFGPNAHDNWSDHGGRIVAYTKDKDSRVYCWTLVYDANGIVTGKYVANESS